MKSLEECEMIKKFNVKIDCNFGDRFIKSIRALIYVLKYKDLQRSKVLWSVGTKLLIL